jgi:hypothetical protein
MAAPVGRPDDSPVEEPAADSPGVTPAVAAVVLESLEIGEVDDDNSGVDVLPVKDVEDGAPDDVVADVVSSAMFHPTTAMAPTVDRRVRVVVAMDHASSSPGGVDA